MKRGRISSISVSPHLEAAPSVSLHSADPPSQSLLTCKQPPPSLCTLQWCKKSGYPPSISLPTRGWHRVGWSAPSGLCPCRVGTESAPFASPKSGTGTKGGSPSTLHATLQGIERGNPACQPQMGERDWDRVSDPFASPKSGTSTKGWIHVR